MAPFRKIILDKLPQGLQQFRSILTTQSDDLIFECGCGARRVFGKKSGPQAPVNQTPLLNCWNQRAHGFVPLLTIHTWVKKHIPENYLRGH